ncbi:alcohol dehydrogenase catalytic domain-containing protein [Croceicoccus sp. F390]|uniref:Alcohol dehydrogenase catalytic domain-containing protein n=1 Tax=Croceicoccus esteveae TaxID=3075597 RepID=A0ABU2ZKE6_9SPHN|nr:alcohol dehydrogenase catalytic domain-containing protein [Croceicoccus sp. F390]MDT0577075.1 alcohol dehydrogenase catalytic domain-containing protein [Croceicoccus sp. F390]
MVQQLSPQSIMDMVRVSGPGMVSLDPVPVPQLGSGDVLIEVANCGLCGSDLGYIKVGGVSAPCTEPFGLGHELSGTIAAVGNAVSGLRPGQRVVVNPMGDGNMIGSGAPAGAFAPYVVVTNATLGGSIHLIPDHVSFEAAALAEPLAVALHAVRRAGPLPDERIAVFGAGPIGLGIIHFLKASGVKDIVAIDLSPTRLQRASSLGATATVNAAEADVASALGDAHGRGDLFGWPVVNTGVFFDVSTSPGVLPQIVGVAPFHARVVLVAVHHAPIAIEWKMVLGKELTITTAMGYPDEFADALTAIAEPGFDEDAFISHRFALAQFHDALAAARARDGSAKVMISCQPS